MLLRRNRIVAALTFVFAILFAATPAFAQDDGDGNEEMGQQGQSQMDPSIQALVPPVPAGQSSKVLLDVVVAPSPGGQPVAGLQQIEFVVRDNNVTQNIQSFRAVTGEQSPAEVVLVIDAVNQVYSRIPYERQQVAAFLRDNGGKLAHPTAIAIFTDTGLQMQSSFTTDGNALADFAGKVTIPIRSIGSTAGFYGAVDRFQKSIRGLNALTTRVAPDPGRKLVLWLSPGWPLLSGPRTSLGKRSQQNIFNTAVALSTRLRNANITLYSISPIFPGNTQRTFYYQQFLKPVEKPEKVAIANLSLQVLAAQSGGLVLNSSNDLSAQLKTAAADAVAYYEMSFDPAPAAHGVEFHRIDVTLTRPGLATRTRAGYYSQP